MQDTNPMESSTEIKSLCGFALFTYFFSGPFGGGVG
jgi:hypothetical protein